MPGNLKERIFIRVNDLCWFSGRRRGFHDLVERITNSAVYTTGATTFNPSEMTTNELGDSSSHINWLAIAKSRAFSLMWQFDDNHFPPSSHYPKVFSFVVFFGFIGVG